MFQKSKLCAYIYVTKTYQSYVAWKIVQARKSCIHQNLLPAFVCASHAFLPSHACIDKLYSAQTVKNWSFKLAIALHTLT